MERPLERCKVKGLLIIQLLTQGRMLPGGATHDEEIATVAGAAPALLSTTRLSQHSFVGLLLERIQDSFHRSVPQNGAIFLDRARHESHYS